MFIVMTRSVKRVNNLAVATILRVNRDKSPTLLVGGRIVMQKSLTGPR